MLQDMTPPPAAVSEVIVRAARLGPPLADRTFSVVTLDIDQVQAGLRVDQALSQAPGVSLFRRTDSLATNPTTQGISLRSIAPSGAGRALVTLDGVPQNDPFGGWVIWAALPPRLLEGVRLVRGGGAGPYGAGALTGVISLTERAADGAVLDVSYGGLNTSQGQLAAEAPLLGGDYLISATTAHSDGFIPVIAGRGAADTPLWLNSKSASGRATYDFGDAALSVRGDMFREDRGSGQVGANARASGQSASVTLARAPTPTALGWRAQAWVRASNLYNSSVSVAAGRATTTVSNIQYDTPATGYGANLALRGSEGRKQWEVGADVRATSGEDRELFSAGLASRRIAGGNQLVGGLYAEGGHSSGPWLVTGGVRLDYWRNASGHLIESVVAGGAVTKSQTFADTSGTVPTARLGVRRNLDDGYYLRAATYAGFRQPTLNELYRPFRVGNVTTNANAALTPEKLYGAEVSAGRTIGATDLSVTLFYNQIDDAVANVTQSAAVRQRQNVKAITAPGIEAQAASRWSARFSTRAGLSYTRAEVRGTAAQASLTGLRPAQAPRLTVTGSADWKATERLTLAVDGRYESLRFDDDLNANRLPAGGTVGVRADYAVSARGQLYVQAGNLFDAKVATAVAADGTRSYNAPRTVTIGLVLRR